MARRHQPTSDSPDGTTPDIPLDTVFQALANARRRLIIRYLAATDDDPASVDTLATHVALEATDVDTGMDVTPSLRERVHAQLHHTHLPKLDNADIIDYKPSAGAVSLAANATAVLPHLRLADQL